MNHGGILYDLCCNSTVCTQWQWSSGEAGLLCWLLHDGSLVLASNKLKTVSLPERQWH